jgi:predicted DNA-binding protein
MMDMSKADVKTTSYRLTPEARRLLAALAEKKGISKTAVLEILIRKEAKEESIT